MKKIEYINLFELQTYPENLILAKIDIEKYNNVEEKQNIVDFITSLKFNSIYTYKGNMIPFAIREGSDTIYILYSDFDEYGITEEKKKEKADAFNHFKEKLEYISCDLSKLKKKSSFDMISEDVDIIENGEYFILKNDFYV